MAQNKFKLSVLGLFKMEGENWTPISVALVLLLVMAFIIVVLVVLKIYIVSAPVLPYWANKIGQIMSAFK
jgi:type IV secretory pathway VirB6-like protein